MAGSTLCPSAIALLQAITARKPEIAEDLFALAKSHSDFVSMLHLIGPKGREMALAATKAEEAFSWALKSIGDEVLKPADQETK
jgi:hypothetical protein